jgi:succinate dehydrogenase / fumarate reductase cytochrome b subunit
VELGGFVTKENNNLNVNQTQCRLKLLFQSSIGRKLLMSLTGMLFALFLLTHAAANLLVLLSPELYNDYAHKLTSNKILLYSAEAGLIGIIVLHIFMAIALTKQNRAARPVAYAAKQNTGRSRRWWGSSNMGITGTIILAFLIFHIWHFKYGPYYSIEQGGVEMRDLARLVIEDFQKPLYAGIYLIAMILIGFHLAHGFRSAFDTLGLNNTKRDRLIKRLSQVYMIIVFGSFIAIPLVIFATGGSQ